MAEKSAGGNKIKNFFDKEEQAPKKEFKRGAF